MTSGFTLAGLAWWNVAGRPAVSIAAIAPAFSATCATRLWSDIRQADLALLRDATDFFIVIGNDGNVAARLPPDQSKQNGFAHAVPDVANESREVELFLKKDHSENRRRDYKTSEYL